MTVQAWIKEASEEIRKQVYEKLFAAANEALLEEQRATNPQKPSDDEVDSVADPLITREKQKIRRTAQKRYLQARLKDIDENTRNEIAARYQENYEAERRSKRRRTSQALNNVELQLNTSRVVQENAERRWVSSSEISNARDSSCRRRPG